MWFWEELGGFFFGGGGEREWWGEIRWGEQSRITLP